MELFYNKARDGKLDEESFKELASSSLCKEILDNIDRLKSEFREQSRTSELWLLYMHYIYIVKAFIFAVRTSNWELHLEVLSEMLNLFAATGHIHGRWSGDSSASNVNMVIFRRNHYKNRLYLSSNNFEANLAFTQPHTYTLTVSDRFRSFIATKVY